MNHAVTTQDVLPLHNLASSQCRSLGTALASIPTGRGADGKPSWRVWNGEVRQKPGCGWCNMRSLWWPPRSSWKSPSQTWKKNGSVASVSKSVNFNSLKANSAPDRSHGLPLTFTLPALQRVHKHFSPWIKYHLLHKLRIISIFQTERLLICCFLIFSSFMILRI